MLFIILSLGCWLKFVFPEIAFYTDMVWCIGIWAFCVCCVLAVYGVANHWTHLELKDEWFNRNAFVRYAMVILSAILTGHLIPAIGLAGALFALNVAHKKLK